MSLLDETASQLNGYDPQTLSIAEAGKFLSALVRRTGAICEVESVPLIKAQSRVLAGDLISSINVPWSDNSAVDGFAFDGRQLDAMQLSLEVVGTAFAGKPWHGQCGAGQCLRVMTGAALPLGLDTVVPQEFCTIDGESVTLPAGIVKRFDNRRLAGEDLARGSVALRGGVRLGPAQLGLIASLGMDRVEVIRAPIVAYFSTGDEILSPGEGMLESRVFDSNRFTVLAMLQNLGCETLDMGPVADDPAALRHAFEAAARCADAIITSGGVSVGEADHTKAVMRECGDVAFWRIAMRPGRPMAVGALPRGSKTAPKPLFIDKSPACPIVLGISSYDLNSNKKQITTERDCVLFGLPGNPVAVMVTFLALVRPALLQLMGSTEAPPPMLHARSEEFIRKKPGRTEYQRGIVSTATDGSLRVRATGQQGSGVLSSVTQANGLMVLPHDSADIQAGDLVQVMMFDGVLRA